MILQAAFRQKFIDQEPFLRIQAVTNKFDQTWMMKLTEMIDLRLQTNRQERMDQSNYPMKAEVVADKENLPTTLCDPENLLV